MPLLKNSLYALLLSMILITSAGAAELKRLSVDDLETIVSMYTSGEYEDMQDGDFSFELSGVTVIMFRLNDGKSLQLACSFSHDSSYESMNAWNSKISFSRAYLDDEMDPVLESDLDLEGGVSLGAVNEFINTFAISVESFTQHIGF